MAARQPFMLTMNHPTMDVMKGLTASVLESNDFKLPREINVPHHHLSDLAIMPVYPFVASYLNVQESTTFISSRIAQANRQINLETFIESCFSGYNSVPRNEYKLNKAMNDTYSKFFEKRRLNRKTNSSKHPYRNIPAYQNWRKSVSGFPIERVDPVVSFPFKIGPEDRVATAGSCFAQHLARALTQSGLNYFVSEQGPKEDGYGLYSARYGNIYTPLQLLQLFDRVYGHFVPHDVAWRKSDDTFVDPFRPEIPIYPNKNEEDIVSDREKRFGYVRDVFERMDYFVFTLGLTESWISKIDGAVFPVAPGVSAGTYNENYKFHNHDETSCFQHLRDAIFKIRSVNPDVRIILTVSPVPLMATFENKHVIVATALSKAILRVTAEKACRDIPDVAYFPSYEIITGSFNRGSYFGDDLRTVRPEGVQRVMSLFLRHATTVATQGEFEREIQNEYNVLCAEEMIGE